MKVETDIITCITVSLIGRVIMFVEFFKTDVVFIGHNGFDVTLTNNFQYQSQYIDAENKMLHATSC